MSKEGGREYFYRAGSDDNNILLPADILLFEAIEPESHLVSKAQRIAGYVSPSANVVHAALYIGYGSLCHAIPVTSSRLRGGVVIEGAWANVSAPNRRLFVLRDDKLSEERRKDIALYAATRSKEDSYYEWGSILRTLSAYADDKSRELKEKAGGFMIELRDALSRQLASSGMGENTSAQPLRSVQAKTKVVQEKKYDHSGAEIEDELGGAVGFVCSDLVVHCYNFILGETSPFAHEREMRFPIYSPADIYLNGRLFSVKSNANEDAVEKMRENLKGQI